MDRKIVNTEDNDILNPMADIRNYGAGTGAAHLDRTDNDDKDTGADNEPEEVDLITAEEPMPDEIADAEESKDSAEPVL